MNGRMEDVTCEVGEVPGRDTTSRVGPGQGQRVPDKAFKASFDVVASSCLFPWTQLPLAG